ncbi:MAG: flagellar protein FlgN [Thiobacillus sp.]
MPPNESSRAALSTRLPAENAAWEAMLTLLNDEEQALVNGEADRLTQLNTTKLTQLQTLNTLAQARHDDLVAAGHTADASGMDAWLAQHGRPEHRASWQQLRDMERQAQAANQRIGKLIELRLNATRQALNVLIQSAASHGGLYDEAGLSVASRGGKPLKSV